MFKHMLEINTITRKWGNSVGILLGKRIKPNKKVKVIISEENITKVKDIFGKLKLTMPVEKLEKEIDKDLGM